MTAQQRTLSVLPERFAICRLAPETPIPHWATSSEATFLSITRTPDELSIMCPQQHVPAGVTADTDWRCLKLEGPFDLDEPGVLAALVMPLAQAGISVFAVATYDTDYLLVNHLELAVQTLEQLTHRIQHGPLC
jgi:hypothetical protein